MITLDKISELLVKKDLSEDEKKDFILFMKPLQDFKEFLMNKLNITEKEFENLSNKYQESKSKDVLDKFDSLMQDENNSMIQESLKLTASIYGDFARYYEYENADDVEKSLLTYLELMITNTFNNFI